MRFLKKKIQLKPDAQERQNTSSSIDVKLEDTTIETKLEETSGTREFLLPMRKPRQKPSCPNGNSKNIVKNYGKALCAFSASDIAIPYLESIVAKRGYQNLIEIPGFVGFIKGQKESVNSIESLRRLLVGNKNDAEEVLAYKIIFKELSTIFLKYFAVNWIFGGKLTHKNAHLKYRFKMLRRIQDPENFTYLKTSAK